MHGGHPVRAIAGKRRARLMRHGHDVCREGRAPYHYETVTALCEACGHVAEIPVADLWRKYLPFERVGEIRLWCTRCGERDRVELDATKALGNDT